MNTVPATYYNARTLHKKLSLLGKTFFKLKYFIPSSSLLHSVLEHV